MAEKIRLRLVTPSRLLLDEEVDEATGPGALGEFGVLPKHISFLTLLEAGEMSYKQGAEQRRLAISGGYAEVLDDVMTVLANAAEYADEIDVERAGDARDRAEKRIAELSHEDKEFAAAEAALRRALVRLQVAGKEARK
ncbi:MAG: F0F1 ATP synthase subunit epsilon [Deltaproteobacteria bacterium]|nr:F0F1 ATP synthase subunit epsilon [Deltaproteobacteria bacterium]MBI2347453.1 F0F1 ATP synthase subunit epsilon [Deltaproteobacteria bacterium]MBI2538637.1 F0F1 ATP synthase subunit epsilon [Deltaproteobacteria bacterium]MBI2990911.1 F0F1 ATP synthase subunit epsilon [Deltaproteobacteria bacterium]MBI3062550.1 F0F1 ATP synthase subunit epsilon [Deltaproteobacteria bacterium]